jgi:hypothetical protein
MMGRKPTYASSSCRKPFCFWSRELSPFLVPGIGDRKVLKFERLTEVYVLFARETYWTFDEGGQGVARKLIYTTLTLYCSHS